jgi:Cu+-exporting ATPase
MKLMNIADERDDSGDSGDGKNDPAALVEADVGMAIDVAGNRIKQLIYIYIVLIKSNLIGRCSSYMQRAIDLSRKTMSRIRLNYVWALGYNILGMPIAAGIIFPFDHRNPATTLASGCLHGCFNSSLSFFVCSSLLLQSYKKPFHYSDSA